MKNVRTRTAEPPGQDSGQRFTWADYLSFLVQEHGSLAAVANKLTTAKVGGGDALTIERGLRRLRTRGQKDGGSYGRPLLRVFGVPVSVVDATRWMGIYHTRFGDLPVSICHEQLLLWDKPPISDSGARAFLQLGFANVALRRGQLDEAESHLAQAKLFTRSADARVEIALVAAYVESQRGELGRAEATLRAAEPLLVLDGVAAHDRACFKARWLDQRAYLVRRLTRDLGAAHALFVQIEPTTPFAATRRALGLAYVAWRRDERQEAEAHARAACAHAGDGGFLRLRVMALNLSARITGDAATRARADTIARGLEDEALLVRVRRP